MLVGLDDSDEANTKGTIQNEQDFTNFYGVNSNSVLEYMGGPEPAPTSTIHDNTATFRCKDNASHYNAYDMNSAEMNSVNYQHPSKEDAVLSKHHCIQSVESHGQTTQNQKSNALQKPSNIVLGRAAVMTSEGGLPVQPR